ncbi:MAG: site-specific DNA-methyltransferase [Pseudomonadota bacterium]
MSVRIITGDALEQMRLLAPESVDCIVTDPPYGQTSLEWDSRVAGWLPEARRVLRPGGSLWCFGSMRFFMERAADFAGWKFAQDVIWEKHNGTGLFNDRFRRVHEIACQFYPADVPWGAVYKKPLFSNDATARTVRKKGRPAHWIGATGETVYRSEDGGPRLMRSVMFARSEHFRAIHPTQKPIATILPLIEYSCPPGGTVLDCFAGSGSVGVAAQQLGCSFIGIEIDPTFADLARDRIAGDLFSAVAHQALVVCTDCPPSDYPTDKTRCEPCPRRRAS